MTKNKSHTASKKISEKTSEVLEEQGNLTEPKKRGRKPISPNNRPDHIDNQPIDEVVTALIKNEIIRWIASGKLLREYCKRPGKPRFWQVKEAARVDRAFSRRLEDANDIGNDLLFEEIIEIADDGRNDYYRKIDKRNGRESIAIDRDNIARSKLRVEARLKLLAIRNPKKFMERMGLETSDPKKMSPVEVAHEITKILAIAERRKKEHEKDDQNDESQEAHQS